MDGGKNPLSERKKLILKAIVDSHIENGEPVGSKFLTQNKQFPYSSATIRNEMAELEALGFLEQPHTSAGRIPTESGYRFYVDSLVDRYNFTAGEIAELQSALRAKQAELNSILSTGMRLASSLTNYTALAVRPTPSTVTVARFEIMRLDSRNLVLVMVLPDTTVKTKHVRSSFDITEDAVSRLCAMLNTRLVGLCADMITLPLLMELEREMGEYDYLVNPIIKSVFEAINSNGGGEVQIEGVNRLLAYPEYYDRHRLRDMLELFEKKDDLLKLVTSAQSPKLEAADNDKDNSVHIYIGSENTVKIMDNSTLVFKTVTEHGHPVGAIGVIGPTRMDYRRVISVLDRLSDSIGEVISDNPDAAPPGTDEEHKE